MADFGYIAGSADGTVAVQELVRLVASGDRTHPADLHTGRTVLRLLADAQTFGVFQMESAGMRRYVAELQPKDIRELAAIVALYRPGPMEHIPRYIEVKHGRAAAHYPHPDLAA